MPRPDEFENKSVYIIREVHRRFKKPALLWSIGKDSTTLLWLVREAFFGTVPFPVIHIDTGYKFKEIYEFRDRIAKEWKLNLIVAKHPDADRLGVTQRVPQNSCATNSAEFVRRGKHPPCAGESTPLAPDKNKFECCNLRKTEALKLCVREHQIDALMLGIRRDEHGIRDKERYFSPRDKEFKWHYAREKQQANSGDSPFIAEQDAEFDAWNIFATDFGSETDHVRVHPILHWSELDVWEYVRSEKIPMVDLYFAKNGKRYRSIGCAPCCKPVDSNADDIDKIIEELRTTKVLERSGRDQDKENEYNMQKLRSLGYM